MTDIDCDHPGVRFREEYAAQVKLERVRRGLTIEQAADRAGITRSTWAKIEKAKSVHDQNLMAALKVLEIDDAQQQSVAERVAELERLTAELARRQQNPPPPDDEKQVKPDESA